MAHDAQRFVIVFHFLSKGIGIRRWRYIVACEYVFCIKKEARPHRRTFLFYIFIRRSFGGLFVRFFGLPLLSVERMHDFEYREKCAILDIVKK
jgi:hypothetical protein